MSNDLSLGDDFEDDVEPISIDNIPEESVGKIVSAKASLMKRRLIDELLIQKRLERSLEDLNFDLDD